MFRKGLTVFLLVPFLLSACSSPAPRPGGLPQPPTTASVGGEASPTAPQEAGPVSTPAALPPASSSWLAYTGQEGNLWLLQPGSGEKRQITQDAANQMGQGKDVLMYCCSQWTSDGQLLAFERQTGKAVASGYDFKYDLLVYDFNTQESRVLLENEQTAGFTFRPGTHSLAYGRIVPYEYFTQRGQTNTDLAQGIWAVDADTGTASELVKPENGFSLVRPRWSLDGQILSFDEVVMMEGRGQFAYYDFANQKYNHWDRIIGSFDWLPDHSQILYDQQAYISTGLERIWINDAAGANEKPFSPEFETGSAALPTISPQGDRVAYWVEKGGPDDPRLALVIQALAGGEPRELGMFVSPGLIAWSPSGEQIAFSAGPVEARQVQVVTVAGAAAAPLAPGNEPAWQPATP